MSKASEEIILGVPVVQDGEVTKYRLIGQESGQVSSYLTRVVNRIQVNGKECYRISAKTEYVKGEITEETSFLEISDILKPVSCHWTTKTKNGNVLLDTVMSYEDESLELPPNTAPPTGLVFSVRGGPFVPKRKITVNLLMHTGQLAKFNIEVSKEKVTVPAGTFECYKVGWSPDPESMMSQMPGSKMPPGFGMVAQHFMPTVYRWYSREKPYHTVKFEGFYPPLPCASAEQIIEELIGIESEHDNNK